MDKTTSTIPKFSSFHPKKPAAVPTNEPTAEDCVPEQPRKRERERVSSEKSSHHKHRSRSSRHGAVDSNGRKTPRKPEVDQPSTELSHRKAAVLDDDSGLYKSDRTGDPLILTYGGLHRYSVPTYFRSGRGSVLGVEPFRRIDRDASNDQRLILQSRGESDTSRRSLLSKPNSSLPRASKILIPSHEPDRALDHRADFVALNRKTKRSSQSPDRPSDAVDYRSIEGKAKASNASVDPDLQYTSESDGADEYGDEVDREAKLKNMELTRLCKKEPQNLDAWLSLIDHQDTMIQLGQHSVSVAGLTVSERLALADIKVSIYQEALQALVGTDHALEVLWLGLLEHGERIWETKKLTAKWEEAVKKNSNNAKVWIGYLNYMQSTFSNFRYERCKSAYLACIEMLQLQAKLAVGQNRLRDIGKIQIYVFLRLTVFMRESGYHEISIALWQALLEFVLFKPLSVSDPAALDSFGIYWDSERPRIGEVGYQGWAQYLDQPDNDISSEPVEILSEEITDADQAFAQFGSAEQKMAQKLALPGRIADEAGEDDPFHAILFSDLSPFLSCFLPSFPARSALIAGFLCYLGLPPLPVSGAEDGCLEWWQDGFLRTQNSTLWVGLEAQSDPRSLPKLELVQMTTEELFYGAFQPNIPFPLHGDWVEKALHTLVQSNKKDDLFAEYFLAFVMSQRLSLSAGKVAKRLLKSRSSSLRLYNAYAIIEAEENNLEAANKVFSIALNMSRSLSSTEDSDTILLWRTWIWQALRNAQEADAIHLLLSVGDLEAPTLLPNENRKTEFDPAVVLKVRRYLTEGRDHTISTGELPWMALYSELLALFSYFHEERSLPIAMENFRGTQQLLQSRGMASSPCSEMLQQAKIYLISYHTKTVKTFKPAVIRELVAESVVLFPNNTLFLTAYVLNESRFQLNDRVRSMITDLVLRERQDTVIGWTIAVWAELQRNPELGGTIYAVRAVFERAVASSSGKHATALWMMYLYFELSKSRERAKEVLFRGFASLPWAKWLTVIGFLRLADILTFDEMQSLYGNFEDKELRLHMNIDELIEEHKETLASRTGRKLI